MIVVDDDAFVAVAGGLGGDTIDMRGMDQSTAFMTMRHRDPGSAITVNIGGAGNTAGMDNGAVGADTLVDIGPLRLAGVNLGGFGVIGTAQADRFNLDPGADQGMQARGGDGPTAT